MKYIQAKSKQEGEFRIPVLDVRESATERKQVEKMVKLANGNHSKFVPAKWGYGPNGPRKY